MTEVTLANMDDLVKFMQQIQVQMQTNVDNINANILKMEMSSMNLKIRYITKETDGIKDVLNKDRANNEDRFRRMETRLEDIIQDNSKIVKQKRKRE